MKKYWRWPVFLVLAVLVIAGSISGFSILGKSKSYAAHAASPAPTITISAQILHPWYENYGLEAKGFAPNEDVRLYFDVIQPDDGLGLSGIHCDNKGICKGKLNTDGQQLAEGPHTLIAVGQTSRLQAQQVFTAA